VHQPDSGGRPEKIVALGMGFARERIRHGFALNVQPLLASRFELITACGEKGATAASVFATVREPLEFQGVRERLRQALASARF
jgi:lipoate-protein ligase B